MSYYELVDLNKSQAFGKFNNKMVAIRNALEAFPDGSVQQLNLIFEGENVLIGPPSAMRFRAQPWLPKRVSSVVMAAPKEFLFSGRPTDAVWREWTERGELRPSLLRSIVPKPGKNHAYFIYIDAEREVLSYVELGDVFQETIERRKRCTNSKLPDTPLSETAQSMADALLEHPPAAVAGFIAGWVDQHWMLMGKRYVNR